VREPDFFSKIFLVTRKFGKKPGFFNISAEVLFPKPGKKVFNTDRNPDFLGLDA
jgi:hypothetical protein